MLACRPMLFLAGMVMAGALVERRCELFSGFWLFGLCAVLTGFIWFAAKAPAQRPDIPDSLPEAYRKYIQPTPGYFSSRGINRFMLVLGLAVFFLAATRQYVWNEHLDPGRLPSQRWFSARLVADAPSHAYPGQTGGVSIPARIIEIDGGEIHHPLPVRLRCREFVSFRRGDIVGGRIEVWRDSPVAFPGAFDFSLFRERDGLVGTVNAAKRGRGKASALQVESVRSPPLWTGIWRSVDFVRGAAIQRTLAYGGKFGELLAAMLFGYRQDIGDGIRDAFRRVGIGHVLAISGLHVGLIVGMFWWLGGWLGCAARWRAVVCLMLSIFFWSLTGGQVAATRATLMAVIHLLGIARGRRADMLNSLGAAACIITFQNPSAPLDLSFQLSFLAVVFIYMTLRSTPAPDQERLTPDPQYNAVFRRRLLRETYSLLRLSVATWIGLFPLIAYAFKQVNPAGLPINVIVIPFLSLVLAGGVLVPWLGWIPGAGWILTLPARGLTWMAEGMDWLPGSSFPVHPPGLGWILVFYAVVGAWMMGPVITQVRLRLRWRKFCRYAFIVCLLGVIASMRTVSPPGEGRIALLPGAGFGVVSAEAPNGEIALIGALRGGGLNEAMWLHSVHRRGKTVVLSTGNVSIDSLSALSWHYPLSEVTTIPATRKADALNVVPWAPVPGTSEIEYAYARNSSGRMDWLAVRTGKRMVTVASRMSVENFVTRIEGAFPGSNAQLYTISFSGSEYTFPEKFSVSGWVAVKGRLPNIPLPGMFRRSRFGVVRLDDTLAGYDGQAWRIIALSN